MKIISLEQGSADWLTWRKSKITATSASILMNNNPWKTPTHLYNEMWDVVAPQQSNEAMARGQALEPQARALFIENTGIEMIPIVCESEENSWMAASLDGWSEENKAILEIKCCNEKTHVMAINGEIPLYYKDQIYHQLAVTRGKVCYYMTYRPEYTDQPIAIFEIEPDWNYIAEMIEVERSFYDGNYSMCLPPVQKTLKMRT